MKHHRAKRLPDADLIVIQAERRNVEEADIRPTLASLMLLLDPENIHDCLERVDFHVAGYDSDPRKLCQVPEVWEWVAQLDKVFPYWFALLNKSSSHSMGFVMFASAGSDAESSLLRPSRVRQTFSGSVAAHA